MRYICPYCSSALYAVYFEAPAPGVEACENIADYTSDKAAADWKIMQAETNQFNNQMIAALESAGLLDIYERVNLRIREHVPSDGRAHGLENASGCAEY
jgi:hypothetical protein